MDEFTPRKIKFKAWNKEARLLMRLNSIDFHKGELIKKDHVLLQFTGLYDKEGEEIYDQDIMLIDYTKFRIFWNVEKNGWFYSPLQHPKQLEPFVAGVPEKMKRFCSFFEMGESV
jgi:hypothetical protein